MVDMDDHQENSKQRLESPLKSSHENGESSIGNSAKEGKEEGSQWAKMITELVKQLHLAGPLIAVSSMQFGLLLISDMFISLGELPLASSSMASIFVHVTGFGFMLGIGSALETFCGQAYGARQYYMLGIHMQRAMLIVLLICIPISILWLFTDSIFTFFGQDPKISFQAGVYARFLVPSIFPYGLLQCQMRFLQAQSRVNVLIVSTTVTGCFHVFACWFLVSLLGFGSGGAVLAIAISYWVNVVILGGYIKFSSKCQKTWTGFSKEGLEGLGGFLSLAVPSALMVCLEFWSYLILALMYGLLQNPQVELISLSLSASSLFLYGLGSAASTRVSNELGALRPKATKLAARLVLIVGLTEGLLRCIILLAIDGVWGYIFTNGEDVIDNITPILMIFNFTGSVQGVLHGIARGCGWQQIGAYVNLAAYYLVGLPLAATLTFAFQFGGKGLWIGLIGGSSLQALMLLAITMSTNWEHQVRKARDRVYTSSIPLVLASED